MSNYTQTTFFAPKDSLTSGDPLKLIKGTDIDPEFLAISTAVATKLDTAGSAIAISSTTVSLDINAATALSASPAAGDLLAIADVSAANVIRKITFTEAVGLFAGTVTATGLSASAGVLSVALNSLTTDATPDAAADYLMTYDASAGTLKKTLISAALAAGGTVPTSLTLTAGSGLTGGGDLSANRSFAIDITGLTADTNPDPAADYLLTYDASATANKKVLIQNLASGARVYPLTASTYAFTSNGSYSDVTGVSGAVVSGNTYLLELFCNVDSTTAGYSLAMSTPGTGTFYGAVMWAGTKATNIDNSIALTAGADSFIASEAAGGSVETQFYGSWYITPNASGNVTLRVKQATADGNTSKIDGGAFIRLTRIA